MFDKILKLLSLPVLGIVISAVLYSYLNQKASDVRYDLSEKLTYDMSAGKNAENIQRLKIKNVGNAPAQKIVVKIDSEIVSHKMVKYAEMDAVQVFEEKKPFEVLYSELPPQGEFYLALVTPSGGIKTTDLSILHSGGVAGEGLSKRETSLLVLLLPNIGLIIYLVISIIYLRKIAVQMWESSHKYKSLDLVLQSEKPAYITSKEWKKLQEDIIKAKLRDGSPLHSDPQYGRCYKFLFLDKPSHLDETTWQSFVKEAQESMKGLYKLFAVSSSFSIDRLIALLGLQKPKNMTQQAWNELQVEVVTVGLKNDSFYVDLPDTISYKFLCADKPAYTEATVWNSLCQKAQQHFRQSYNSCISSSSLLVKEFSMVFNLQKPKNVTQVVWDDFVKDANAAYFYLKGRFVYKFDDVVRLLKENKPVELMDSYWKEFTNSFQDKYYDYVAREIGRSKTPLKVIESNDFNLLKVEHQEELRQSAKIAQQKLECESLIELFKRLARSEEIGEVRPQELSVESWNRMKAVEHDFVPLKGLRGSLEKYELDRKELLGNQAIVKRQLDFINDLLTDPRVLERVESYDNTFAPGNFKNLKKVGQYLKTLMDVEREIQNG